MVKAELKAAVDQHVCPVNGNPHRLRLQWAAVEPRWVARGARYLLAIDVLSDASLAPLTTLHVMTRATATRQELLDLVDDAVDEQMRRIRLETGGSADVPCRELIA